ncbi:hypothetical protein ACWESM_18430 [Nocardia sp. NPDC003999]
MTAGELSTLEALVEHGGEHVVTAVDLGRRCAQDPARLERDLSALVGLGLVREHVVDGARAWRPSVAGYEIGTAL